MKGSKPFWRRTVIRSVSLVLIGAAIGVGVNAVRTTGRLPWRYAWSTHVETQVRAAGLPVMSVATLRAAEEGVFLLFDARPAEAYHDFALPDALSFPLQEVEERYPEMHVFIFPEQPIVTYCSGADCDEALQLALFLREQGHTNIYVLVEGVAGWQ